MFLCNVWFATWVDHNNIYIEKGWNVKVIVGISREVVIKSLAEYQNVVQGINYSTCYYNKLD